MHEVGWGRGGPRAAFGLLALVGSVLWGALFAFNASAQDASGPIDGLMEDLHLKAHVAPAPDFVTRSRPSAPADFIPVGTPHPARSTRVMTPAEVTAAEADLDTAREQQQRRAGRRPAAVPLKKPAGAAAGKNTVR